MGKPVLIVMAAGMGSRFGGLKQMKSVTDKGEIIIDFSLYDAMKAGFENIVFIIKKEMEADMRRIMDRGAGKHLDIAYAFQSLDDLPPGYGVPEGREKPWGTAQATLCARGLADGPFAVINADDYYGSKAFHLMYKWLSSAEGKGKGRYSMVGYLLRNTLTDNGHVTRGVCRVDDGDRLCGVDERFKVMRRDGAVAYEETDGSWVPLPEDAIVSMNFWGFTPVFMEELARGFPEFLDRALAENPLKGEYLLPVRVDDLLKSGDAEVEVMYSDDRWHGVTYPEDLDTVVAALQALKDRGAYPAKLWA